MTNDRLLDDAGDLQLVAPEDRVWGPGSTPIMAAFTHLGFGSRFATDTFGAYYAASTLETAIAETVYHKERELAAANEESIDLTMRCYVNEVSTPLHDIRGPGSNTCTIPRSASTAGARPMLQHCGPSPRGGLCTIAFDIQGRVYCSIQAKGCDNTGSERPPDVFL